MVELKENTNLRTIIEENRKVLETMNNKLVSGIFGFLRVVSSARKKLEP